MEFNDIIQAVSTVGFPIIVGIFFLKRLAKQDQHHYEQFDKIKEAVDNNTKIINELLIELRSGKDERY